MIQLTDVCPIKGQWKTTRVQVLTVQEAFDFLTFQDIYSDHDDMTPPSLLKSNVSVELTETNRNGMEHLFTPYNGTLGYQPIQFEIPNRKTDTEPEIYVWFDGENFFQVSEDIMEDSSYFYNSTFINSILTL